MGGVTGGGGGSIFFQLKQRGMMMREGGRSDMSLIELVGIRWGRGPKYKHKMGEEA